MAYLIGQIWVLIVAASLIGLVLGWLLSEAVREGRRPPQADDLEARLDSAVTRAEAATSREADLAATVRRLTDDKTSLENQLSMLGNRLREAEARAEAASRTGDDASGADDAGGVSGGDASGPKHEPDSREAGAPPAG